MSTPESPPSPQSYESSHVHQVYESIAPHFSSTRHKPWPLIAAFLASLPAGSVGLDVGCGNGKYLRVNPTLHLFGSDRSPSLLELARRGPVITESRQKQAAAAKEPGNEEQAGSEKRQGPSQVDVLVADALSLPFPTGRFDFAISVAVVHHLSTRSRRRAAVAALLSFCRPGGRVLVYVWALEQRGSRRGWDEGSEQDALVPWVMRRQKGDPPGEEDQEGRTYQRYYHLYRKGELEEDVEAVGGVLEESGYEKDNWWAICRGGEGGGSS